MASIIEQLQQLGFSQYEAQAYVALLRQSPANGYELAKASGIPRPNIYTVLQKLEERGAVLRVDGPEGVRYTPTPPRELLDRLHRQYTGALEAASGELEAISAPPALETVLNARGYPVLLDHARALLDSVQRRLLLSIWPEEAVALAGAVEQAQERGVEITTLCLRGCPHACPACRGAVFRYPIAPAERSRWLVLVGDDTELLAGEITPQQDAQAVRTRQKMLVNLTASYIQNSIALASILSSLGSRLDTLLEPQVLAAINAMHPLGLPTRDKDQADEHAIETTHDHQDPAQERSLGMTLDEQNPVLERSLGMTLDEQNPVQERSLRTTQDNQNPVEERWLDVMRKLIQTKENPS